MPTFNPLVICYTKNESLTFWYQAVLCHQTECSLQLKMLCLEPNLGHSVESDRESKQRLPIFSCTPIGNLCKVGTWIWLELGKYSWLFYINKLGTLLWCDDGNYCTLTTPDTLLSDFSSLVWASTWVSISAWLVSTTIPPMQISWSMLCTLSTWKIRSNSQTFSKHLSKASTNTCIRTVCTKYRIPFHNVAHILVPCAICVGEQFHKYSIVHHDCNWEMDPKSRVIAFRHCTPQHWTINESNSTRLHVVCILCNEFQVAVKKC